MWTPWNQDILFSQDTLVCPNAIQSGHLSNQDTPSRSRILGGPLFWHNFPKLLQWVWQHCYIYYNQLCAGAANYSALELAILSFIERLSSFWRFTHVCLLLMLEVVLKHKKDTLTEETADEKGGEEYDYSQLGLRLSPDNDGFSGSVEVMMAQFLTWKILAFMVGFAHLFHIHTRIVASD